MPLELGWAHRALARCTARVFASCEEATRSADAGCRSLGYGLVGSRCGGSSAEGAHRRHPSLGGVFWLYRDAWRDAASRSGLEEIGSERSVAVQQDCDRLDIQHHRGEVLPCSKQELVGETASRVTGSKSSAVHICADRRFPLVSASALRSVVGLRSIASCMEVVDALRQEKEGCGSDRCCTRGRGSSCRSARRGRPASGAACRAASGRGFGGKGRRASPPSSRTCCRCSTRAVNGELSGSRRGRGANSATEGQEQQKEGMLSLLSVTAGGGVGVRRRIRRRVFAAASPECLVEGRAGTCEATTPF
mmetsp:Transcript_58273/g.130118  ORF Transcript_58273/g.130118 Transcript_58273/m.130118 type:complete len:306 (+) Transcript_58273:76-993(+)